MARTPSLVTLLLEIGEGMVLRENEKRKKKEREVGSRGGRERLVILGFVEMNGGSSVVK